MAGPHGVASSSPAAGWGSAPLFRGAARRTIKYCNEALAIASSSSSALACLCSSSARGPCAVAFGRRTAPPLAPRAAITGAGNYGPCRDAIIGSSLLSLRASSDRARERSNNSRHALRCPGSKRIMVAGHYSSLELHLCTHTHTHTLGDDSCSSSGQRVGDGMPLPPPAVRRRD